MDFESVLSVLRTESEKRRRRTRIIRGIVAGLFVLQIVLSIVLAIRGKFEVTDILTIISPLILIGGISAGFSPQAKAALLEALPGTDSRLVGFLCEALGSGDADFVAVVRERLEPLLAEIEPGGAILTPDQQTALVASLPTATEQFQVAAIRGLTQIGNKEAILTLEQYAAAKGPKAVVSAARGYLPDLRMRLARNIIDSQLDRTAQAPPVVAVSETRVTE